MIQEKINYKKLRGPNKKPRSNAVVYPRNRVARQCTSCHKIGPTDEMFYYYAKRKRFFSCCKKCHIANQHKKKKTLSTFDQLVKENAAKAILDPLTGKTVITIGPENKGSPEFHIKMTDLKPKGFAL